MAEEWAIEIRDQCRSAKVAFFFKQWGGDIGQSLVGVSFEDANGMNIPHVLRNLNLGAIAAE